MPEAMLPGCWNEAFRRVGDIVAVGLNAYSIRTAPTTPILPRSPYCPSCLRTLAAPVSVMPRPMYTSVVMEGRECPS
jgi:hypothetical protein